MFYGDLHRVQFYLHPEELSALKEAALDAGIPVSTFVRMNLVTILRNRGYQIETREKLGDNTLSGFSTGGMA